MFFIDNILAGMWGFFNERSRELATELFRKMIDVNIASKYHKNGTIFRKGGDQSFLTDHIYPFIKDRSIIHDSYKCEVYKDGEPFPTERAGFCYVAIHHFYEEACMTNKSNMHDKECPFACRPAEHKNWKYC